MRSYTRFGQRKPVTAQRDGTVTAGNHQLEAARRLGWTELAVVWTDDDESTSRAWSIADNRTGDLGVNDPTDLLAMIEGVKAAGDADLLAAISYSDEAIKELVRQVARERPRPTVDPDDVPDPPAVPVTKPGDLWLLGEHRLLCGDATQRDDMGRLLDGCRPDALITDPPYGVSHGAGITDAKAIRGDIGQAVIPVSFAVAVEVLSDDARLYLFGGSEQTSMYNGLWDHHLHQQPRVIVWVKETFVMRQIAYHSQFEVVYWGWKGKGGGPKFWFGDRKTSDVWQVSRDPNAERVHPTQKPVAVLSIPIRCSVPLGGSVLDPFGGSGTTLIAAEDLERRAYIMEIDPAYCDVICQRYQAFTGVAARLAEQIPA